MSGPRAAVDVGTNSIRVLVVDGDGAPLVREMTITRLGQDVDRTGRLDDAALDRTLGALRRYRRAWEDLGAASVRVAATSAVRDAADRDRFFAAVRDIAGVDAEVLSGDDEAAAAFRGATSAVEVPHPVLVLDVGGGSTELIVGDAAGAPVASVSLQLGCVRLTERMLASDPPSTSEITAARTEVTAQLDVAARTLGERSGDPGSCASLVGVAGTVTTMAALHLGLDRYDPERIHGTSIPRPAVAQLTDRLLRLPVAERRDLGPMAPGREDIIAAGALIVLGAVERFGFDALVASEADLLDGLIIG